MMRDRIGVRQDEVTMIRIPPAVLAALACLASGACSGSVEAPRAGSSPPPSAPAEEAPVTAPDTPAPSPFRTELATFAGGCYWCVEAVFEQVPGVIDARSGFMGGHAKSPTYDEVCMGGTGHAEVVQVRFDPSKVTYAALLDWFWRCHDPTTLDRQGADVGDQYRSAIFVHDDAQRKAAVESMKSAQADFDDPIVTQIADASDFHEAPKKHQDFYGANREYGYCRAVIRPKLKKLGLKE
ncbi:MAG: Peptide methionine sulfoxide reductase MsrA [Planctomycetes bacterium]|nr:Peptide methionine sulfoxide reductase MsrA [Planctomycetota bacterium]